MSIPDFLRQLTVTFLAWALLMPQPAFALREPQQDTAVSQIADELQKSGLEAKKRPKLLWLDEADPNLLERPISDLYLSIRVMKGIVRWTPNLLWEKDISRSIGFLMTATEGDLLEQKNFGPTSLQEVKDALEGTGLRLRNPGEPLPAKWSRFAEPKLLWLDEADPALLKAPFLEDRSLSVRARNVLEAELFPNRPSSVGGILTLSSKDLLGLRYSGEISVREVRQWLAKKGLRLRNEGERLPVNWLSLIQPTSASAVREATEEIPAAQRREAAQRVRARLREIPPLPATTLIGIGPSLADEEAGALRVLSTLMPAHLRRQFLVVTRTAKQGKQLADRGLLASSELSVVADQIEERFKGQAVSIRYYGTEEEGLALQDALDLMLEEARVDSLDTVFLAPNNLLEFLKNLLVNLPDVPPALKGPRVPEELAEDIHLLSRA